MAAIVATANKLARIIYAMVETKSEFDESNANNYPSISKLTGQ